MLARLLVCCGKPGRYLGDDGQGLRGRDATRRAGRSASVSPRMNSIVRKVVPSCRNTSQIRQTLGCVTWRAM